MATLQQRVAILSEPTDSDVIHLRTLRKTIGFLGILLPFTLVVGENIRDQLLPSRTGVEQVILESSISAYFHTGMREVFVGYLCAIAVFLICYRGLERWDDLASTVAGLAALVVALFPTSERSREALDAGPARDSVTFFSDAFTPDPPIIGVIHLSGAAVFFVTLAMMALLLFTRSGGGIPTAEKLRRNNVYRFCGGTMLGALVGIVLGKLLLPPKVEMGSGFVFWFESIAVVAFGVAWLTKAEVLFGDKPATAGSAAPGSMPTGARAGV